MTLAGTIEKTLFFSEEDGVIIFLLNTVSLGNTPPPFKRVKVKGKLAVNQTGLPLLVTGEIQDTDYGKTLIATDIGEFCMRVSEAKEYLSAIGKGVKESTIDTLSKLSKGRIFQLAASPSK